jgi:hypothetical protein
MSPSVVAHLVVLAVRRLLLFPKRNRGDRLLQIGRDRQPAPPMRRRQGSIQDSVQIEYPLSR